MIVGFGAPWVVALWAAATLLALGWLVRQARRRTPVTVTSFIVLFWFFLPILLQYPFTYSPLNIVFATGPRAYAAYVPVIDQALLVSLAGMAAFALTRWLLPLRARPFAPVRLVHYGLAGWTSSALIWLSGLAVVLLFLPLAMLGVMGAEGMRNMVLTMPALRPLFNTIGSILPLLVAVVLLTATEQRRRSLWVLLGLLLLLALLTGSRAVALGGAFTIGLTVGGYHSLRREVRGRAQLRWALIALPLLFLVLYLGDVRSGQYNPLATLANLGGLFFYAYTFSDLRDFAWVLGFWDGRWFLGRTQLAGILGFVPSVLWPFRVEWGFGRVSTAITGITFGEVDASHAGLRVGMFGESYFNFGWPGAVLAGVLMGWLCVRLEGAARHAIREEPRTGRFAARLQLLAVFTTLLLAANLFISAAFYSIYVTLGVLLLARLVRVVLRASIAGMRGGAAAPGTLAPAAPAE